MPDPSSIMTRIRAVGANVEIDGKKLRIINGKRVSSELRDELRQHVAAVANWLEREVEPKERSAVLNGGSHPRADEIARMLLAETPEGCDPADWSWFVTEARKIIDARGAV